VTGADRVRYLNGQVTNDVRTLQPGAAIPPQDPASRSCYACVTNAKGKLEADVFITELPRENAFLIDADPSLREPLLARLENYIIADDVRIEDVTGALALFHVLEGRPGAPESLPSPARDDLLAASASNRFGLPGTDFILRAAQRDPCLRALPALAAPELLEILRIACGIPKWGAELTPGILPPEAGLQERAISYTKGCYVGQEIISRMRSAGRVNRQLVAMTGGLPSIAIASSRPVAPGTANAPLRPGLALYTGIAGKPDAIGILTSCASHAALAAPIALGYVKTAHAAPGTRVYAGAGADPLAFPLEIGKTPLISIEFAP
jgi:folate-binding protein YgfZ